ncbi:hypothetical protein [Thermobispora bispora]|uniref:hypothetical protein n=1 Tax=Thermobispora bispora TaxID=2006 RepID=UPI00197F466B|nr:hypothetical protein [Thermobispora bispora]QSI49931.1 hypothetical protein CYL17_18290 [Thermobispora bispora]QSI50033.1 hypothetical protein CYL17_18860 [Thermobispora bispora]
MTTRFRYDWRRGWLPATRAANPAHLHSPRARDQFATRLVEIGMRLAGLVREHTPEDVAHFLHRMITPLDRAYLPIIMGALTPVDRPLGDLLAWVTWGDTGDPGRDQLAARLLDTAIEVATLVRDATPDDVAAFLAGLPQHERDLLPIIQAALIPPDEPPEHLLAWFLPPGATITFPVKGRRPCGTRAAAQRHRYAGEPLCPACKKADRKYERERERARRRSARADTKAA